MPPPNYSPSKSSSKRGSYSRSYNPGAGGVVQHSAPKQKVTPKHSPHGGGPGGYVPPKKKVTPVTTGGASPFSHTKQVGITSNYVNPVFRKHIIDTYNKPRSWVENLQNIYGEEEITPIGYVPKSFKPKKPLKKTAWDYATTEGVGAQEFADWRKTEPASLFEGYHSDYGDQLQRELELSDKIKTLGEDYVKGFDIKGIGDSYDDQRQAVNTLLGDIETKKEKLRKTEGDWMEKEDIERTAKSQLQSGYLENKDRLDDLGITSLEEYKEFLNKSIGLASGGLVNLYKYGGIV